MSHFSRAHSVILASVGITLVASSGTLGCLRLKSASVAAAPPPPHYMSTKEPFAVLDVAEESQKSASFVLDGKPFCFSGTNNYYMTFKGQKMVDDAFAATKAM